MTHSPPSFTRCILHFALCKLSTVYSWFIFSFSFFLICLFVRGVQYFLSPIFILRSIRATDTSSKGDTNVSSKQVHVLNTRAGLFHVRKCPPHVAGQTSDNYHHSYQILSTFYMPVIVLHTL